MTELSKDFPAKLVYQPVLGFIEQIASKSPAPGGGSAAALSGAVGAGLLTMVINLTVSKKDYANVAAELTALRDKTESLRGKLTSLIDEDTAAFNKFRVANKLLENTDEEKAHKAHELAIATQLTIDIPEITMQSCLEGLSYASTVAMKGNVNTVSDVGVGAEMLYAGLEGASLNVLINLSGMESTKANGYQVKIEQARTKGRSFLTDVRSIVAEKLRG